MAVYGSAPLRKRLEAGFRKAGKELDMGKSCVHFKQADDLALEVVGEMIASTPLEAFVASAKAARRK